MTTEQYLREMLGEAALRFAVLAAERDALKAELDAIKAQLPQQKAPA